MKRVAKKLDKPSTKKQKLDKELAELYKGIIEKIQKDLPKELKVVALPKKKPKEPEEALFVKFTEDNGWELETWSTFIRVPKDRKILRKWKKFLDQVTKWRTKQKKHVNAHKKTTERCCAWCTTFTLYLDIFYTKKEAKEELRSGSYMDDEIMEGEMDHEFFNELIDLKTGQNFEEAWTFLYKGGFKDLFT